MVSLRRVAALVLQEFYISRRSLELFADILFFPLMNVVLFGLISHFLGYGTTGNQQVAYLMLGILLWEVVAINQYNVTVSSLWGIWSHNLTNLFIAPISLSEYLGGHIVAAAIRTALVTGWLAAATYWLFGFNLLTVGWANLLVFAVNLSLFAWWIGIILLGLIFRFGTRVQALAWGTIFLFQPLTASFFPVSVLPPVLQPIAHALPATYVFEAGRQALTVPGVNWQYAGIALGLNVAYGAAAVVIFKYLFKRSRTTGQFARNDL